MLRPDVSPQAVHGQLSSPPVKGLRGHHLTEWLHQQLQGPLRPEACRCVLQHVTPCRPVAPPVSALAAAHAVEARRQPAGGGASQCRWGSVTVGQQIASALAMIWPLDECNTGLQSRCTTEGRTAKE
jgi:hypothetical protein